jgi:hypothetical protein
MTEAQAVAEMVEMAGELGALKEVVKKAHPDWSGLPKGTSIIATARELLDSLTADLARARADNEFARKEWEIWEAKACELQCEVKKLKAELDESRAAHELMCGLYVKQGEKVAALTADLAAARQEFAEWLDASRTALDTHAEVVAELDAARESLKRLSEDVMRCIDASWKPHHGRDYGAHLGNILAEFVGDLSAERHAARESRDVAERALRMHGYRKSCDIPACNCGDQWIHGGTSERRLREVLDENAETRADRDRLAACVERVRYLCGTAEAWQWDRLELAEVLAALEGANG